MPQKQQAATPRKETKSVRLDAATVRAAKRAVNDAPDLALDDFPRSATELIEIATREYIARRLPAALTPGPGRPRKSRK